MSWSNIYTPGDSAGRRRTLPPLSPPLCAVLAVLEAPDGFFSVCGLGGNATAALRSKAEHGGAGVTLRKTAAFDGDGGPFLP